MYVYIIYTHIFSLPWVNYALESCELFLHLFQAIFLSKWSHRDLFKCSLGHPGQSNLEAKNSLKRKII